MKMVTCRLLKKRFRKTRWRWLPAGCWRKDSERQAQASGWSSEEAQRGNAPARIECKNRFMEEFERRRVIFQKTHTNTFAWSVYNPLQHTVTNERVGWHACKPQRLQFIFLKFFLELFPRWLINHTTVWQHKSMNDKCVRCMVPSHLQAESQTSTSYAAENSCICWRQLVLLFIVSCWSMQGLSPDTTQDTHTNTNVPSSGKI